MTMDEYIEREALYEKAYWHGEHPDVGNPFPDGVDAIDVMDVDAIPAADVAPVRHGRWGTNSDRPDSLICSVCNCGFDMWKHDPHNYCPNCGARMLEEE